MRTILLLLGISACVDAPTVAADTRHVDIPRGADRFVALDTVASVVSSDPQIAAAAITPDGVRVTGAREGDASIAIEHGDLLTTIVAHVVPPAIVQLVIDPVELATSVGSAIALRAMATDTSGATADVTQLATWRIDDPTIAALDDGALRGMTPGDTVLHAEITDATISVAISVE